ncbi:MAG: hypothetical protein GWN31_11570 [Candidatus Thorarchaeota archaeon]|nr:hypothetical protein [Candidatus Thorarchaeota archaeon]NIW14543.1 hypothetical protein [Candidatus Thorarchaeota archaeon]NIW52618.1 hypothetical protein [Candidatus Korarchaeota archaeon]
MLKDNPRVSFTVDNGKLMKEAMGITMLGRAETYSFDARALRFSTEIVS